MKIEDEKDERKDKKIIREKKREIRKLESEADSLLRKSEKLIDLNNQIIVCLDTPEPEVYNTLMCYLISFILRRYISAISSSLIPDQL